MVMSDKALVKKLQREVARLENELRCAGTTTLSPDSTALILEKDLEIEKVIDRILTAAFINFSRKLVMQQGVFFPSLIYRNLQLKKEISEVILQRDSAQSQVKDLLRAAEEDRPSESVSSYLLNNPFFFPPES